MTDQLQPAPSTTSMSSSDLADLVAQLKIYNSDGLPAALQSYNSWLTWVPAPTVVKSKDGSNTETFKVLKKPTTGNNWLNRPLSWIDAQKSLLTNFNTAPGFIYSTDHPFICIDLDAFTDENIQFALALNSYTEVSPSGKGLHILVELVGETSATPPMASEALSTVSEANRSQPTLKLPMVERYGRKAHNTKNKRDLYIATGFVTITGIQCVDQELEPVLNKTPRQVTFQELSAILDLYFKPHDSSLANPDNKSLALATLQTLATSSPADLPSTMKKAQVTIDAVKQMLSVIPVKCLTDDILTHLSDTPPQLCKIDPLETTEARAPWLAIGQALHHEFNGNTTGYMLWLDWSSQGNKFDLAALTSAWESFGKIQETQSCPLITIRTLIKLAAAQVLVFVHISDKGFVLPTVENTQAYLNHLGVDLAVNELSKQVEVTVPPYQQAKWPVKITNKISLGTMLTSDFVSMPQCHSSYKRSEIMAHLDAIAINNTVNPIKDYFLSCCTKWDGVDRFPELFATVGIPNNYRSYVQSFHYFLRKWMLQVVAAATHDPSTPCILNRVVIFIGPQGIGKTLWVQSLFPESIRPYCAADKSIKVSGFRSDDVKLTMELASSVICNINEIDRAFLAQNFSEFKAFLDKTTDTIVLPYGRTVEYMTRRTVFIGSSNNDKFLKDMSGNRRFELIHVNQMNHKHHMDLDQLWGQAAYLYMVKKEAYWLDQANHEDRPHILMRDMLNSAAMAILNDEYVDLLEYYFDADDPEPRQLLTLSAVNARLGVPSQPGKAIATQRKKDCLMAWLQVQDNYIPPKKTGTANGRGSIFYYMPKDKVAHGEMWAGVEPKQPKQPKQLKQPGTINGERSEPLTADQPTVQ